LWRKIEKRRNRIEARSHRDVEEKTSAQSRLNDNDLKSGPSFGNNKTEETFFSSKPSKQH
jgi:hypothetical protein